MLMHSEICYIIDTVSITGVHIIAMGLITTRGFHIIAMGLITTRGFRARTTDFVEVLFSPEFVCLSVCLSVSNITRKVVDGFG